MGSVRSRHLVVQPLLALILVAFAYSAKADLRPCPVGSSCKDVIVRGPGERARLYAADPRVAFNETAFAEGVQMGKKDKDEKGQDHWIARVVIGTTEFEKTLTQIWSGVKGPPHTGEDFNQVQRLELPGGSDLTTFEPFSTPQFDVLDGSISLLATFDLSSYLASPVSFADGEILDVTNGSITRSPSITFFDASSVFGAGDLPDTFSEADVALFPRFTGKIVATGSGLTFDVPEPSSIILIVTAGVVFALGRMTTKALSSVLPRPHHSPHHPRPVRRHSRRLASTLARGARKLLHRLRIRAGLARIYSSQATYFS
jgi:hypothetical protein